MVWHLFLFISLFFQSRQPPRQYLIEGAAQGTTYHITYYSTDSMIRKAEADSLFRVLDRSLSIYQSRSVISRFNKAKKKLKVDHHLATVVARSQEVWKDTEGLFDITVQPLVHAWGFGARPVERYPDSMAIAGILPCIGTEKITLDKFTLTKQKRCVTIDVNGIAQGYSVDLVADFLEARGLSAYIVEVGGEIRMKGRKPGGEKMKIGIEAPGHEGRIMQKIISLEQGAVTTSGNYRKFQEADGHLIHHIINPVTGYPVQNELISVTVVAPDAMTADAYDNALMAMGLTKALAFVEERENLAAFFIYRNEKGEVLDTASSRFQQYFVQ